MTAGSRLHTAQANAPGPVSGYGTPNGDGKAFERWAAANVDSVDITLFGRGGHGARPHTTRDPVVADLSVNQHGLGRELFAAFRQNVGPAAGGAAVVV